jgi:hypothetical protein
VNGKFLYKNPKKMELLKCETFYLRTLYATKFNITLTGELAGLQIPNILCTEQLYLANSYLENMVLQ